MAKTRSMNKGVAVPKGPKRQLILKRVWNNVNVATALVPYSLTLYTATEECIVHVSGNIKFVNAGSLQDLGRAVIQVQPNGTAVLPAPVWTAQDFGEELMWHQSYVHDVDDHADVEIVTTKRKLRKGDVVTLSVFSSSAVAPNAEGFAFNINLYVTQ